MASLRFGFGLFQDDSDVDPHLLRLPKAQHRPDRGDFAALRLAFEERRRGRLPSCKAPDRVVLAVLVELKREIGANPMWPPPL